MMNLKTKSLLLLTTWLMLSLSLSAQNQKAMGSNTNTKRSVAAKLLVELDKTPKGSNNNNGRSNRDRCCNDGIIAPSNYQVIAFGISTSWYLWEEGVGDVGIPNPIPYLQSMASNWEVTLYDGNVQVIATKSAFIQDNELLLSVDDLSDGRYFLEIHHSGNYYATGFSIGTQQPQPQQTYANKTRQLSPKGSEKHARIIKDILVELDKTPKGSNRNNGRSNKSGCCKDEIAAPSNSQWIIFGPTTSWYARGEIEGQDIIPNPIPYLQSIKASWEVLIFNNNAEFLSTHYGFIEDNKLQMNTQGLANGRYFIQIEDDGIFYATGFSIGAGPKPPTNTTLQNKN